MQDVLQVLVPRAPTTSQDMEYPCCNSAAHVGIRKPVEVACSLDLPKCGPTCGVREYASLSLLGQLFV